MKGLNDLLTQVINSHNPTEGLNPKSEAQYMKNTPWKANKVLDALIWNITQEEKNLQWEYLSLQ